MGGSSSLEKRYNDLWFLQLTILYIPEKQKGLKLFLLNVACYILHTNLKGACILHQIIERMKLKLVVEDVSVAFNPIFLPRSCLLKRWSQNLGTFVLSSQSIIANLILSSIFRAL